MERQRRVYPAEKSRGKWLSWLFLLLTALVLVSGIWGKERADTISIQPVPTATPIPLEETFDETMAEVEIVLPAAQWFALQFGAFENQQSADEMAQKYISRGAAGYIWNDGRYRVLAAIYPQREDAQQVREQLEVQHAIDSYIYPVELPSVRVKLKGMQGQLDILQAAFIHGHDLIAQLQMISARMDRREMDAAEAEAEVQNLGKQVETVSLRLKQRFLSPRHETVDMLIACMEQYMDFCTRLDSQSSAAALGTRIKYQTFASLEKLKQVYDTLRYT